MNKLEQLLGVEDTNKKPTLAGLLGIEETNKLDILLGINIDK